MSTRKREIEDIDVKAISITCLFIAKVLEMWRRVMTRMSAGGVKRARVSVKMGRGEGDTAPNPVSTTCLLTYVFEVCIQRPIVPCIVLYFVFEIYSDNPLDSELLVAPPERLR